MTFPISSFEDIFDAMDQNPEFARRLTTYVLTRALINLPAVVGEPQAGDPPNIEQLKRTDVRIAELKTVSDRVDGRTGDAEGRVYEDRVATVLTDQLYLEMGLTNSKVVFQYPDKEIQDLFDSLNQEKPPDQQLDISQMRDLKDIDMVARATRQVDPGEPEIIHVAVEASITGEDDDLRRADRRSRLIGRLTNSPCLPAIAAETLSERVGKLATTDKLGKTAVSKEAFNSLGTPGDTLEQDITVFLIARRK